MKAPRRGLRLAEFQLLLFLFLCFLLPDVIADDLFGQLSENAHRGSPDEEDRLGVGGLVDLAHPPLADEGGHVVVPEAVTDGKRHRRSLDGGTDLPELYDPLPPSARSGIVKPGAAGGRARQNRNSRLNFTTKTRFSRPGKLRTSVSRPSLYTTKSSLPG